MFRQPDSLYFPEAENVNIDFPTESQPVLQLKPMVSSHSPAPQYGCLKNGSLPTYRNFMNKTVKNMGGGENTQNNIENKIWDKEKEARQQIRDLSLRNQQKEMNKMLIPKKVKRPTKKKTIKRTYKIGRSKNKTKYRCINLK